MSEAAAIIDKATKGYLRRVIERGDMNGSIGSTLLLHDVPGVACTRVLLLGLGPKSGFTEPGPPTPNCISQSFQSGIATWSGASCRLRAQRAKPLIVSNR
jgi:hypothetical protein